jgi:hypothetical protein
VYAVEAGVVVIGARGRRYEAEVGADAVQQSAVAKCLGIPSLAHFACAES